MKSRDFCYWLQGYFELATQDKITIDQVKTIQRHLSMVFKHEIDPSFGEEREELVKIHHGKHSNLDTPIMC